MMAYVILGFVLYSVGLVTGLSKGRYHRPSIMQMLAEFDFFLKPVLRPIEKRGAVGSLIGGLQRGSHSPASPGSCQVASMPVGAAA